MDIAFLDTQKWEEAYFKQRLPNHTLKFITSAENKGDDEAEILSNFVAAPVTKETLKHFPKLKYISTRSTGFDHIDFKACKEKNILASNVPAYGENTVAEFTFALILALARKIYPAIKRVHEEGSFKAEGLTGFDLKGKTIGIIGTGHIGEHVVRMAYGFEMKILAFDANEKAQLKEKFGCEYVSLSKLLKSSDIVTLHLPYSESSHHLIDSKRFELFKKGAVLINTARGGLIDTQSLIKALDDGTISGAALDVLEEEGYIKEEAQLLQKHPSERELMTVLADHDLMAMDNVIVTPHTAFNTQEALERILDTTIENINAFISGKPVNLVL
jgi:D-lactate dehydrogenase